MKKLKGLIIVLLLSVIATSNLSASHVMGADITYVCLGNNQYEVTLTVYRDCEGIEPSASYTINFASANCGQNFDVTFDNDSAKDVTPVCATAQTTCNGGTLPGTEAWYYTETVTFPQECSDWLISWDDCCRNANITNLQDPDLEGMYFEYTLDNTNGLCNNSPQYSSLPTPYICVNQLYTYNHGAYDNDGDSLVYELIQPLSAANTTIPYEAGYSVNDPVITSGGFNFDQITGEMCFTPSQQQFCIVSVKIYEYRDQQLIATHIREMQVVVSSTCTNTAPTIGAGGGCGAIGGVDSVLFAGPSVDSVGVNQFAMCPDDSIAFRIMVVDAQGDNVTVNGNIEQSIPGAYFDYGTTNNDTAIVFFSWVPTIADTGVNTFTLGVQDDACPILGVQNFYYQIFVYDQTNAGPDQIICGPTSEQPGQADLHAVGGSTFNWVAISGDPIVVGSNFSCNPCANPVATPSVTTEYEVTSNLAAGCKNVDTVTVFVVPDFDYITTQSDDAICLLEEVQFVVTPTVPASGYTYRWYPETYLDDDSIANPTGSFTEQGAFDKIFEITSPDGCTKSDTLSVTVSAAIQPDITVVGDTTVCQGGGVVRLSTETDVSAFGDCIYTLDMFDSFGDGWNNYSLDIIVEDTLYGSFSFTTGSTSSASITVSPGDVIGVSVTDEGSFPSEVSWNLIDGEGNVAVNLNQGSGSGSLGFFWSDETACGYDNSTYGFVWSPSTGVSNVNSPSPYFTITATSATYQVIVTDSVGGCSDTATVNLYEVPNFGYTLTPRDTGICLGEPDVVFNVLTDAGTYTYAWGPTSLFGTATGSSVTATNAPPGIYDVAVTVSSAFGCDNMDTVQFGVGPSNPPLVNVVAYPETMCEFDPDSVKLTAEVTDTTFRGCQYCLHMYDDFGDGWNGGFIELTLNGQRMGPYSAASSPGNFTETCFNVTSGDQVSISYTPANWDNENSYYLLNASGDTIFSDGLNGATPGGGNVWSGTTACPSTISTFYEYDWCPDPSLVADTGNVANAKPTSTTTFCVTVTDGIGGCSSVGEVSVSISSNQYDATISAEDYYCDNAPQDTLTVPDPYGTWSSDGPGIIDDTLGIFDPGVAGVGTHNIYYLIDGGCGDADTITVTVISPGSLSIVDPGPYCQDSDCDTLVAIPSGGIWSGAVSDATLGVICPKFMNVGTNKIIYSLAECNAEDSVNIVINPAFDPTILNLPDAICDFGTGSDTLNLEAEDENATGFWSGPGIIDSVAGSFSADEAGIGFKIISYTFSTGCKYSDSDTIYIGIQPNATIDSVGGICATSTPIQLTAAEPGGVWAGDGIVDVDLGMFDPTMASIGTNFITYRISGGCVDKDTLRLVVSPGPQIEVEEVDESCELAEDGSIAVTALGGQAPYAYAWSNGATTRKIEGLPAGDYFVTITDSTSCVATAEGEIIGSTKLCETPALFIPNVFSPNGIGNSENDIVQVKGVNISKFEIKIYNRWGEKVYESTDLDEYWDGTHNGNDAAAGVYVYYVNAVLRNGQEDKLTGTITLIR